MPSGVSNDSTSTNLIYGRRRHSAVQSVLFSLAASEMQGVSWPEPLIGASQPIR